MVYNLIIKVLRYIFLVLPLVIIFYYSIQFFNKVTEVRIEGYSNAIASLMFFFTDLVFLFLFLIFRRFTGRQVFIRYCWIFGALFVVGVFLSNTYLWIISVLIISIIGLFNLLGTMTIKDKHR
jgi:hypothetical protein